MGLCRATRSWQLPQNFLSLGTLQSVVSVARTHSFRPKFLIFSHQETCRQGKLDSAGYWSWETGGRWIPSLPVDVIMPGVAAWVPEQPVRLWLRVNLGSENSCAPHLSVVPTSHLSVDAGIILILYFLSDCYSSHRKKSRTSNRIPASMGLSCSEVPVTALQWSVV